MLLSRSRLDRSVEQLHKLQHFVRMNKTAISHVAGHSCSCSCIDCYTAGESLSLHCCITEQDLNSFLHALQYLYGVKFKAIYSCPELEISHSYSLNPYQQIWTCLRWMYGHTYVQMDGQKISK